MKRKHRRVVVTILVMSIIVSGGVTGYFAGCKWSAETAYGENTTMNQVNTIHAWSTKTLISLLVFVALCALLWFWSGYWKVRSNTYASQLQLKEEKAHQRPQLRIIRHNDSRGSNIKASA